MRYRVAVGDRRIGIDATPEGRLLIDGRVVAYDAREIAPGTWSVVVDGRSHEVVLLGNGRAHIDGSEVALAVADERALAARTDRSLVAGGRHELRAPMPGLLKAVHVKEGDIVQRDGAVATLEAMKMENELRAPARATVQRLAAVAGSKVESGSLIAVLVEEPA
ncbi:MAG: biotin/lipoyl-binding protein [Chloroflexi bacterium]|nr:biotin/lipoyl-binding protein [Chloroflexota bacterium]